MGVVNLPANLGEMDVGVGMVPSEKALVSFYRPSSGSISTRFPEILDWEFWVGVENPQSWGKKRPLRVVPFERALDGAYMTSVVTFLFLYFCAF